MWFLKVVCILKAQFGTNIAFPRKIVDHPREYGLR
jgi:hypothetical protein